MSRPEPHPDAPTLALLAGGELPLWSRWKAQRHVRSCRDCQAELEKFRALRASLPAEAADESDASAELPGIAWSVFEAEMRANIRLGLTAGALAGSSREDAQSALPSIPYWRWATVCGALVFVIGAGWWLSIPAHPPTSAVSLVSNVTPPTQALDVATQAAGFQLPVPASNTVRTEADFSGGTRARLIDGETGQVTLQQVYAE